MYLFQAELMSIDQVAEKKSILNLLCEIILVFTKCPSDEPNDPENDNPNDLDEPDDLNGSKDLDKCMHLCINHNHI